MECLPILSRCCVASFCEEPEEDDAEESNLVPSRKQYSIRESYSEFAKGTYFHAVLIEQSVQSLYTVYRKMNELSQNQLLYCFRRFFAMTKR